MRHGCRVGPSWKLRQDGLEDSQGYCKFNWVSRIWEAAFEEAHAAEDCGDSRKGPGMAQVNLRLADCTYVVAQGLNH